VIRWAAGSFWVLITVFSCHTLAADPWSVAAREVPVPMMEQTQTFRIGRQPGVKVLEMGYVGDELAMMILLPDSRDGLGALEGQLSLESLERWTGSLRSTKVKVVIPRFRIEPAESIRLKSVLSEMGMPLPFTRTADFSGMANPSNPDELLQIDNVYHKAFVEVNEEGTEAAAATAVVMKARGARIEPNAIPEFIADHPFLFLIRDREAGTILFIGRVDDPSSH
jgi:serpin B